MSGHGGERKARGTTGTAAQSKRVGADADMCDLSWKYLCVSVCGKVYENEMIMQKHHASYDL
eukprot:IDg22457t1